MPLIFMLAMLVGNPPVLSVPDAKDVWIAHLHICENDVNKEKILDSNDKYSYGYLMFQMDTWLSYGKPFGATMKNISDPVLQTRVARSMLDDGEFYHWKTCVRKTTKKWGAYPSS